MTAQRSRKCVRLTTPHNSVYFRKIAKKQPKIIFRRVSKSHIFRAHLQGGTERLI